MCDRVPHFTISISASSLRPPRLRHGNTLHFCLQSLTHTINISLLVLQSTPIIHNRKRNDLTIVGYFGPTNRIEFTHSELH